MLLQLLRERRSGRPGPLARILAVLVVLGLISLSAPVLIPVVAWVLDLL